MSWVWFMDALGAGTTQFSMSAAKGSYALTGHSTGVALVADGGVIALTGHAAKLHYGHVLAQAAGAFALSGGDIGQFVRTHLFIALHGQFRLSGPRVLMHKTKVPVSGPAPFVENAWEQPENESNLDAQVEWEAG